MPVPARSLPGTVIATFGACRLAVLAAKRHRRGCGRQQMRGLQGKRVLITGAATGIGRARAIRFAEEGASVAVNFFGDPEPAEALVDELTSLSPEGGHVLAPADVSDEDAVDSLFAGVVQA